MKKFLFFKMLLFAQFIFLFSNFSYSQTTPDCPTGITGWTDRPTAWIAPDINGLVDNLGLIDYKTIINGNTIDVKIDWSSLQNTPTGNLQSLNFNFTDEELQGFAVLAVLHDILHNKSEGDVINIRIYESATCTITHNCYFKTETNFSTICIDPELTDIATKFNPNGQESYWVKDWTEDCGIKCCIYNYAITVGPPDIKVGGHNYTINSVTASDYTTCTPSGTYDCKRTTVPEQCTGNCDKY